MYSLDHKDCDTSTFLRKMTYDDVILCIINEKNLNFENHRRWVARGTKFDVKTQDDKVNESWNFGMNITSLSCIINEIIENDLL